MLPHQLDEQAHTASAAVWPTDTSKIAPKFCRPAASASSWKTYGTTCRTTMHASRR